MKRARLNPLDGVFQRVPRISAGALPPSERRNKGRRRGSRKKPLAWFEPSPKNRRERGTAVSYYPRARVLINRDTRRGLTTTLVYVRLNAKPWRVRNLDYRRKSVYRVIWSCAATIQRNQDSMKFKFKFFVILVAKNVYLYYRWASKFNATILRVYEVHLSKFDDPNLTNRNVKFRNG